MKNLTIKAEHNLALKNTNSKYHLVLNPDVILLNNAIEECLNFMSEKKNISNLNLKTFINC